MNIRKKIALWLDPTPARVNEHMYDLMLKAGRRCAHDFVHCAELLELHERDELSQELYRRAREWVKIFYPDGGQKNYHASIVREYEQEISRLKQILRDHDADPDGDIPF